jgi:voltage-gated potassium channel
MQRHYQVILESLLSFFIIIDLIALGLTTIGLFVGIKPNTVYYVAIFDAVISFFIFLDLIIFRIIKGEIESKWQFLRDNWAFIISIIPLTFITFNLYQLFGLASIIGLITLVKIYALIIVLIKSASNVRKYPSKTKLDYATFILIVILILGSYLFFITEKGINPEVPNYESAMWFAIVSMATVGYGDIVPFTLIGRIIAVIFILTGMGYLSLVTATLAYSFIDLFRKESRKAGEKLQKRTTIYNEKIDELLEKVDTIEKKVDKMDKENKNK